MNERAQEKPGAAAAAGGATTAMTATVRVGTASWSDPEFVRAGWYPKGLPAGKRLDYYAERFDLVELNSSFYAAPGQGLCARWADTTPEGFLFDVKVHRLLSRHATKPDALPPALRGGVDIAERTGNVVLTPELEHDFAGYFLEQLVPLERAGKLGALLLQLTPGFAPDRHDWEELGPLLDQLRGGAAAVGGKPRRVVVEPRHRGWLEPGARREGTLAFFRERGVTLAGVDAPAEKHFTILPPDFDAVTQPALAYLRLHGRDAHAYLTGKTVAERFHYDYSDAELGEVAARVARLGAEARETHVIFNNNSADFAPRAAERFRALLGQTTEGPPSPGARGELF